MKIKQHIQTATTTTTIHPCGGLPRETEFSTNPWDTGTVVTSVCVVDGVTKENIKEEFVARQIGREDKSHENASSRSSNRYRSSGFDIQSFCFGHEGFVAKVVLRFRKCHRFRWWRWDDTRVGLFDREANF